jgi:hypothetical protein
MTQEEFENLIKPGLYQVFLLSCPPSLPLSFARHPWFVVNKKGVVSRWEVIANPQMYDIKIRWGHLCKDSLPPWQGIGVIHSAGHHQYVWPSTLHGVIEGDEASLARQMADVIETSPQTYPYLNRYAYTGPNSNTYAQWVLNKFASHYLKLPWNAFGKGFK